MFLRTLAQRTKLADKLMPFFRAPERKLRQVFEITFQICGHAAQNNDSRLECQGKTSVSNVPKLCPSALEQFMRDCSESKKFD